MWDSRPIFDLTIRKLVRFLKKKTNKKSKNIINAYSKFKKQKYIIGLLDPIEKILNTTKNNSVAHPEAIQWLSTVYKK